MKAENCEHIVGIAFWCSGGGNVTEKDVIDFINDSVESAVKSPFEYCLDFSVKDINALDSSYELELYDYCPYCGCKLDKRIIKRRINAYLKEKIASIDKAKYYTTLYEQKKKFYEANRKKPSNKSIGVGYVYLVKLGEDYKIGVSKQPTERLGEFTKLPVELEKICVVKVKSYKQVEEDLHELFEEKHKRGEWYSLESYDIEFIKSYLEERRVDNEEQPK